MVFKNYLQMIEEGENTLECTQRWFTGCLCFLITEGKLNLNAFLQGFSLDLFVILTLTHLFDN